ncbi:MAG: uracil-DNA glycosylase [Candidatus Promineifilaceae bacterium]|nr:uracil-DNA glycosylase [Candidatus Promineifilaceae bacterium]
MEQIAAELHDLEVSPLYDFRIENDYHVVVGEGDVDADLMFIGEAPGAQEAKSGRPFVGASGRVLNELLETIGLDRDDVYITNVVKDRPPDNRDPHVVEIELYTPFLMRQLEIIEPKVIATLGRFAMEFVLEQFDVPRHGQKISDLHGQPMGIEAPYGPVTLIPLYHPAVALYNRSQRSTLEEDFQVLKRFL